MVFAGGGIARELFEGVHVRALEEAALALHPAIEFGTAGQVKPIEERTTVEVDRSLEVPLVYGGLEVDGIDAEDLGVQPELAHPDDDLVVADFPADGVQRLVEGVASALFLDVRPERADQSIARHPGLAATREEREDRESSGLCQRAGECAPVAMDGEATQNLELQHCAFLSRSRVVAKVEVLLCRFRVRWRNWRKEGWHPYLEMGATPTHQPIGPPLRSRPTRRSRGCSS